MEAAPLGPLNTGTGGAVVVFVQAEDEFLLSFLLQAKSRRFLLQAEDESLLRSLLQAKSSRFLFDLSLEDVRFLSGRKIHWCFDSSL